MAQFAVHGYDATPFLLSYANIVRQKEKEEEEQAREQGAREGNDERDQTGLHRRLPLLFIIQSLSGQFLQYR